MTKAESERVIASKEGPCVVCTVWSDLGHMPAEDVVHGVAYDHKKSGNIRIGHHAGFGSCDWHHQGYPLDGWTSTSMRQHYGPSLVDGSRLFRDTYGTNDELIEFQTRLLGAA